MYWYYENDNEDLWVPDIGSNRWRRQFDVAAGTYQYQRFDSSNNAQTAWGTAAGLGAPAQITAANAQTRLVVDNSDDAMKAYGWLRELAVSLAARLLAIRENIPAAKQDAAQYLGTVNYLLEKDGEAFHKAQQTGNDDDRTRLVRLGAKFLGDEFPLIREWARYTAALGAQQQPLLALAQRGADLGPKLLAKLQ